MLFALFWLSVLVAALVFTGLGVVLSSGIKGPRRKGLVRWFAYFLFGLLFALAALWAGAVYWDEVPPGWVFPYWAGLAAAYLVLGWFGVRRIGRRLEQGIRGRAWKRALWGGLFLVLACFSWILLDRAAEKRLHDSYLHSRELAESAHVPCRGPEYDALPYYEKAAETLAKTDEALRPHDPAFWLQTPEAREFLEKNRAVLPLLREAASRPDLCVEFDPSNLWKSLVEGDASGKFSIFTCFHFARLLYLDALERVEEGDIRGAMEDLHCVEAMEGQFRRQYVLLSTIYSLVLEKLRMRSEEAVWARVPAGSDPWKTTAGISSDWVPDFRKIVTMELAFQEQFWHWFDKGLHDAAPGKPEWLNLETGWIDLGQVRFLTPVWAWRVFYSARDLEYTKDSQERFFAAFSRPAHQIHEALVQKEKQDEPRRWLYHAEMYESQWCASPYFLRILAAEAGQRLSFAARACYAFHAQKGRWPENLGVLIPDFLEQAPVSPFSLAPLGYEQVPGGARLFIQDVPSSQDESSLRDGPKFFSPKNLDFYVGRGAYEEFRVKPWREALAAAAENGSS